MLKQMLRISPFRVIIGNLLSTVDHRALRHGLPIIATNRRFAKKSLNQQDVTSFLDSLDAVSTVFSTPNNDEAHNDTRNKLLLSLQRISKLDGVNTAVTVLKASSAKHGPFVAGRLLNAWKDDHELLSQILMQLTNNWKSRHIGLLLHPTIYLGGWSVNEVISFVKTLKKLQDARRASILGPSVTMQQARNSGDSWCFEWTGRMWGRMLGTMLYEVKSETMKRDIPDYIFVLQSLLQDPNWAKMKTVQIGSTHNEVSIFEPEFAAGVLSRFLAPFHMDSISISFEELPINDTPAPPRKRRIVRRPDGACWSNGELSTFTNMAIVGYIRFLQKHHDTLIVQFPDANVSPLILSRATIIMLTARFISEIARAANRSSEPQFINDIVVEMTADWHHKDTQLLLKHLYRELQPGFIRGLVAHFTGPTRHYTYEDEFDEEDPEELEMKLKK